MARESLDAHVVVDPDNVSYLTNFFAFVRERPFVLIVPCAGSPPFVVPTLKVPHVQARAIGALDLVQYFEFPAPAGKPMHPR
jgi:Xaa-Pro dipeptidase